MIDCGLTGHAVSGGFLPRRSSTPIAVRLAPIPDQKVLASFLNLAVGDTLAVLLADSIGTSDAAFARALPGGPDVPTR